MKTISTTINYGNDVPNIPVLKSRLQISLEENELKHANDIANEFLSKTLISKTFFDVAKVSSIVSISRKFKLAHPNFKLTRDILEYAALIIFGNLFIDDSCPLILDVTLRLIDTENLAPDPALQQFTKGTPTNIFEITLSTREFCWYKNGK